MKLYTLQEHFLELRTRLLRILVVFTIVFVMCYYFSDNIYNILLKPLAKLSQDHVRKVIYTGLTEAFFTYLKLAVCSSFIIITPIIAIEAYLFISPGLYADEKKIAAFILFMVPILFWCSSIFVFYLVMPYAWHFFLSFENHNTVIPLILEAKISEYLNLIIQVIIGFGFSFQLPIIILILNLLKIINLASLRKNRRLVIVINFIIAAILTPPDIFSQFALAVPLYLLYEISIIMCQFIENRGNHVRYKMD